MTVTLQVSRADVEAELWRWSGWKAQQQAVDAVLNLVARYKVDASDLDPLVEDIMAQARSDAMRIIAAARKEAEAMRPPPALCPGCVSVTEEAAAKRRERSASAGKRVRVPETVRKCRDCGIVKGIDRFNRDVKSRNGRKAQCKECEAGQRKGRRTVARAQAQGKRVLSINMAS